MASRNRRSQAGGASGSGGGGNTLRTGHPAPYPQVAVPPVVAGAGTSQDPVPGTSAGPGGASDFLPRAGLRVPGASGNASGSSQTLEEASRESGTCTAPDDPDLFLARNLFDDSFSMLQEFYREGRMCDVVLKVGSKSIKCHRVVLACVSAYFRSMFQSDMMESRQSEITIKELDEESVQLLIDFCYSGQLHLTVDNVQMLLYAASILQMETPASACSDYMIRNLDPYNCIAVLNFAEAHGNIKLLDHTIQFIEENFQEVRQQEDFFSVHVGFLERLFKSDNIKVRTEIEIYESILAWVTRDTENRKQHLALLLENARLNQLPSDFLLKEVSRNELVRADFRCRDLVDDAKSYWLTRHNDQRSTDYAQPRRAYAGVVFCVGGRGSFGDPFKSVECYDVRKNLWFTVADMTTKRRHVGVVSVGDKLYAIGGHDGARHLNTGEMFDPRLNKWRPMAPMNTFRRGLAVACLRGTIYALGGLDDQTCYRAVERYDTDAESWSQVQPLNIPRGGVAVATLTEHQNHNKDYLYAVGGNDGSASLDSCERYDPLLNKWTLLACMSKRRAGAGCSELDGYIYVVGGFDDNAPLDTCERYDPATNQWTLVAQMSCPRGGVGVATLAGKIFAVGGHDGTNYLNSAECYDARTNRWHPIGSVGSCRAGAGTAYCNIPISEVRREPYEEPPRDPAAQDSAVVSSAVNSCV